MRCMWTLQLATLVRVHRGLTGRTGFVNLVTPQLLKMSTILIFDCPAYAHIRDEFPALSQILFTSVNMFINTDDFNMLGRYRTGHNHRRITLACHYGGNYGFTQYLFIFATCGYCTVLIQ